MFKQLKSKEVKFKKFLKHNSPKERTTGKNLKKCMICGNPRGHVGKYRINMCRRCFRLNATKIGFKKYN